MRDNHSNVSATKPTGLAPLIRAEIERCGPISFERFMDLALYAPGLGYYARASDPFGRAGDFYTAEQIQPVFGILIAQFVGAARLRMGYPADFGVVELGAGRGEMAGALDSFGYTPVDLACGEWPRRITGVVLANEFFDALPVRVAVLRGGIFKNVLVTFSAAHGPRRAAPNEGGNPADLPLGFRFVDGPPCGGETLEYLERYYRDIADGDVVEIHLRGLEWLDRIAEALTGWLLLIDYGYTSREFIRFGSGTLMSYRRHTATADVLADPGGRDITAHVPFTVVRDRLEQRGLIVEQFETLASFLLGLGQTDQFAEALRAGDERESLRRRMQLKTLLYGMGETFRVLVASSATQ